MEAENAEKARIPHHGMGQSESVVLLKTHDPFYAETVNEKLSSRGISCEILDAQFSDYGQGDTSMLSLLVPADQVGAAKKILNEEGLEEVRETAGVRCASCDYEPVEMDLAAEKCPGCEISGGKLASEEALLPVLDHAPGTKSFCPACREVSVETGGACRSCGEPLSPAGPDARLCPNKLHIIDAGLAEQGIFLCLPCRTAWTLGLVRYHGGFVTVPVSGEEPAEPGAAPSCHEPESPGCGAQAAPKLPKVHCPHCKADTPSLLTKKQCEECGFAVVFIDGPGGLEKVLDYDPTTKTFCRECRQPSTFTEGECGFCDGALCQIGSEDRLCKVREHVVEAGQAEKGFFVCVPCEAVLVSR